MSRTLARLRSAMGDQLLVRAGRALVPTPLAAELRDRVHALAREAQAVLQPRRTPLDLAALERTFTVRVSEAFMEQLSAHVVAAVTQAAPRLRLRFASKLDKDARPLREGLIDLEIGVLGTAAPEIRTQFLYLDKLVGVARIGHPLLSGPGVTPERYAACHHIVASRDGSVAEPIDDALAELGLRRQIVVVVPGFPDAMRIVARSDLVALVPRSCLGPGTPSDPALAPFEPPLPTPSFKISAMWHPRMDSDPAHRWLRETIMSVCRTADPRRCPKPAD